MGGQQLQQVLAVRDVPWRALLEPVEARNEALAQHVQRHVRVRQCESVDDSVDALADGAEGLARVFRHELGVADRPTGENETEARLCPSPRSTCFCNRG